MTGDDELFAELPEHANVSHHARSQHDHVEAQRADPTHDRARCWCTCTSCMELRWPDLDQLRY